VYNNILVAIDLSEDPARRTLAGAQAFAEKSGKARAKLSVVHVVEPQYVQYSFDPTFTGSLTRSLEHDALEGATNRVAELCEPFGIPRDAQHVMLGRASDQIHDMAKTQNADLIVIGSHGHHGWRVLLGSTANAVLHGAPVDVIVVRIPKTNG
jgi:universal stress protein A